MAVFDTTTLDRLLEDTESRDVVESLARRYRGLLEHRVSRLEQALVASDTDQAMDAVLSLRVSSTMTGALEMADLAARVEDALRRSDLVAARAHAESMPTAAQRLDAALVDYLQAAS